MVQENLEALEDALAEARTVIDHQIDLIERTEQALLRFIRLNLLALGAFLPIVQLIKSRTGTSLSSSLILWLAGAAICLTLAIILSSITYRRKLFFAGLGDSPSYSIYNPDKDKAVQPPIEPGDAFPEDGLDLHSGTDFYEHILWDYSKGIQHNNRETSHRYRLLNRITYWMTLGLLMFFVGVLTIIYPQFFPPRILLYSFAVPIIVSLFLMWSSVSWLYNLDYRAEDERRFTEDDYKDHHDLNNDWVSPIELLKYRLGSENQSEAGAKQTSSEECDGQAFKEDQSAE